jgi:hypothetical protein
MADKSSCSNPLNQLLYYLDTAHARLGLELRFLLFGGGIFALTEANTPTSSIFPNLTLGFRSRSVSLSASAPKSQEQGS